MSACLSRDMIDGFLAANLAPAEAGRVSAHLAQCAACQRAADELAADPDLRRALELRRSMDRTVAEPISQEFKQELYQMASERDAETRRPPEHAETRLLSDSSGGELRARTHGKLAAGPSGADASAISLATTGALPTGRIGRFELRGRLGIGGFGVVYRAWDPNLGREVALKVSRLDVMLPDFGDLQQCLLAEATAAARIDHPNVNPVYDVGEAAGTTYIATAYCPGPNLAQWLADQKDAVPIRTALEIIAALADGIEAAHRQRILHRDIKPSNVLLMPLTDPETETHRQFPYIPRLTDFGAARIIEASQTQTRSSLVLGTPIYMAPEQAEGRRDRIGVATDIYGLGAMLYELLTKQALFRESSLAVLLDQVRSEQPESPRRLRREVPQDVETICMKCLRKEPQYRYRSAGELAIDLRRTLHGEPIAARPLSAWQRMAIWCKQRQRIHDAGTYTALVNVAVPVWALLDGLFFAAGYVPRVSGMDIEQLIASSVMIALLHFPVAWLGWKTAEEKRGALWAGTVASVLLVAVAFGGLLGWLALPFGGGAYEDGAAIRTVVFCLLLVIFAIQLAAHLAAHAAWHANQGLR